MAISVQRKQELIKEFQVNPKDCGSSEVQVAILSERIKQVTEHLKNNPKDFLSRRGLLVMVGKRSALLQYLKRKNFAQYKNLIERLGIRK